MLRGKCCCWLGMELLPARGRKPGRQDSLSACRHKKNVRCSKQRSPGSVLPKMYPLFCPRSRWNPDSRLTRDLTRHQSPKRSDACAQEALAGKKAGRAFRAGDGRSSSSTEQWISRISRIRRISSPRPEPRVPVHPAHSAHSARPGKSVAGNV